MFVKLLCKIKSKCKIDYSINHCYENTCLGPSLCWALWKVGTNDSRTRQLLVSNCLQSGWGVRQGNHLNTVCCSVRSA